jgi:hypothetical protein
MFTYTISELAILHLDAGNDTNGNPRRLYVALHAPTGNVLSVEDEGYEGTGALLALIKRCFRTDDSQRREIYAALVSRVSERIRIAPSYRTHLLRKEQRASLDAKIHGRPTLTLD